MSDAPVLFDSQDHIATITINRPENRNSMTADVMEGFRECIRRAADDRSLRVAVITGRGKSFCAGADFRGPKATAEGGKAVDDERLFNLYGPFLDVFDLEIPTIGALNGHAVGGGFGLTLVCDIRIANRDARYGANFSRLGLHSGMAVSYLLPRIVGVPKAAELLFTGKLINGAEAETIGLAHEAVAAEDVHDVAMRWAGEIAAAAPEAVRLLKRSLYRGAGWAPRDAARLEAFAQAKTMGMDDAREGIKALLEKREPTFTGT